MTNSMLAAVRAAASEPDSAADTTAVDQPKGKIMTEKEGVSAAAADSISKTEHEAALAKQRQEHETTQAAAVAAAKSEGASAERARILGIEKAALAGHDALVAEMKADGKTSPEQAALRIVEAEKQKRGQQMQSIKDVETEGAKVPAAVSSAGHGALVPKKATTPEGWKAEYEASDALQQEFGTPEAYVAYKKAEANGLVRRLVNRTA